jgi:hypothetical protein
MGKKLEKMEKSCLAPEKNELELALTNPAVGIDGSLSRCVPYNI